MLKPVYRTPQVSLSSCLPSTFARETCVLSHFPGLALPVPILNAFCALGSPPEQIFSLLRSPVSLKKTSALPCLFNPSPVAPSAGQGRAGQGKVLVHSGCTVCCPGTAIITEIRQASLSDQLCLCLSQVLVQAIKEAKEQHPDMSVTKVVVHQETEISEE